MDHISVICSTCSPHMIYPDKTWYNSNMSHHFLHLLLFWGKKIMSFHKKPSASHFNSLIKTVDVFYLLKIGLRIPAALTLVSKGRAANPQKLHFSFRPRWPEFLGQCLSATFCTHFFCLVGYYLPSFSLGGAKIAADPRRISDLG